ncbi:sulfatase family protein [Agaribacter flavus]|uniref:Sulfatase n=1 Tax=Agaribacter flavus TaxID=1902781 RepID=A0ABV7FMY9_9ALTE
MAHANMKRVNFLLFFVLFVTSCGQHDVQTTIATDKPSAPPNIIWVVLEDISTDLGTYGHPIVKTPNLDKIASQGIVFENAFSTSSVCSPSRSAFFTGMHQTSIGAHHHRSHLDDGYALPEHVKMLSEYLREADYFSLLLGPKQKTDFNFSHVTQAFDATDGEIKYSGGAYTHAPTETKYLDGSAWQAYKQQAKNKPFFAQINFTESHRTFVADRTQPINIEDVSPPSYYPDHNIVKRDWALYLETIQMVDKKVGNLFAELKAQNALDNTIVFIFGDHGRAMLRDKQWLYDGGLHVPFIVWGKGIEQGQRSTDMLSLIDVAPSTLALAGIDVPEHMEGKVIVGKQKQSVEYVYAQRDRCDETDDRIRAVIGKDFHYIRNFMPDKPYTQFNAYKKLQYPVLTLMQKMHEENTLNSVQAAFFAARKPLEELYDRHNDPEQINNLANDPKYANVLSQYRIALVKWQEQSGDMGMVEEAQSVKDYWDNFFEEHYAAQMAKRGLSTDIDHDSYLAWWDTFLLELGK